MSPSRTSAAVAVLAAAMALTPVAPALAQTTPATVAPSCGPSPQPSSLTASDIAIDAGDTHQLLAFGRLGADAQLFAATAPNSAFRLIIQGRTSPYEDECTGAAIWTLQPFATSRYYAVVDGVRTETITVAVRERTATIGVRQAGGVYTFSGVVAPSAAGEQVTLARLDGGTGRVTGVASTRTSADGRYQIRTRLPRGFAGFYALTPPAPGKPPVRSRLYGLIVPR